VGNTPSSAVGGKKGKWVLGDRRGEGSRERTIVERDLGVKIGGQTVRVKSGTEVQIGETVVFTSKENGGGGSLRQGPCRKARRGL